MRIATALRHFKTRAGIVRALPNRTKAAIYHWDDVVPLAAARHLEAASSGKCKVDESLYNEYGQIIRKRKSKRRGH